MHCKPNTVKHYGLMLKKHIVPRLGWLRVSEVKKKHILKFQFGLSDIPTVANRTVDILVKMFNMAGSWEMRPPGRNPCRSIRRYKVEPHKERFLTPKELARLGRTLDIAPEKRLAARRQQGGSAHRPDATGSGGSARGTATRSRQFVGVPWPEEGHPSDQHQRLLEPHPQARRPGGRDRSSVFRAITVSRAAAAYILAAVAALALFGTGLAETWRGLIVAPEHRCSPYDRNQDYHYPQSIEREIVHRLGAVYGPYTGTCFSSTSETDIEHMVATSEAHDSGLCATDRATRARFATDLRNLTLASPGVNRHRKSGKDAGEWLPERNRCWFAARIVEVRRAYGLTIDQREAQALERVLAGCTGTAMEPMVCHTSTGRDSGRGLGAGSAADGNGDALAHYDDNRNGRITCKEARRHGIAPVRRDHPAYRYMRDGDGDGIVCE